MTRQGTIETVGLMGPFGYGNLGDAAIVDATIQNLRRRLPEVDIVGFTLNPDDTEARHGIRSFPLSRMSWRDEGRGPLATLLRRLRDSDSALAHRVERVASRATSEVGMLVRSYRALDGVDALVMSGSGQLQDYWGGGGPGSYPYTMLRWAVLARLRGARFDVVSVGAGPVDARLSRTFFRWALGLATYRSYRDEWSRDFVRDVIGFTAADDDPVYPDLAFSLDVAEAAPAADGHRERPVVGIGPIGYYRPGSWPETDEQRWATYRGELVELVVRTLGDGNDIMFLKGEAVHDQPVIDELLGDLSARGVELDGRVVERSITTVEELLHALSDCDAVIGSRFHNVLLGYVVGRPVVGIAYQSKTASLMEIFDDAANCISIDQVTAPRAHAALRDALRAGPADAQAVAERNRKELEEQYDRVFAPH